MTSPTLDKLHHFFTARRTAEPQTPDAVALSAGGLSDPARPRTPLEVAAAARRRSANLAEQAVLSDHQPPVAMRVTGPKEPAAVRRARSFAQLVAGMRFGPGPDAGPQLSARALARFQSDPFVQRLARLH